jgi:hypothetical protein
MGADLLGLPWRHLWNLCGTLQGTLCQQGPTPPSTGTLISRYGCSSCFPALAAPMKHLRDTAGNPLPAGANPAIHWNTYLQVRLFFLLSALVAPMEPLQTLQGTPCQLGPTLPSTGTIISRYRCSSCFPALEAPMEPQQDTAGNPLPARANPAIHRNTYLQVRLRYGCSSCFLPWWHPWNPCGQCREPSASQSQPRHPLEHLSPGTVVLLAFLPWRRPWNPFGILQGTPCHLGPTLPSTGAFISMQIWLSILLSCPGGSHGTPAGNCREPSASQSQPRHPLEHLYPGTVVLLAFLLWRRPWNPCGTLQGTPAS